MKPAEQGATHSLGAAAAALKASWTFSYNLYFFVSLLCSVFATTWLRLISSLTRVVKHHRIWGLCKGTDWFCFPKLWQWVPWEELSTAWSCSFCGGQVSLQLGDVVLSPCKATAPCSSRDQQWQCLSKAARPFLPCPSASPTSSPSSCRILRQCSCANDAAELLQLS